MTKYRGKYTKARDCVHADNESTEWLMAAVEVTETCPMYEKLPQRLVPVRYCQNQCQYYEKGGEE